MPSGLPVGGPALPADSPAIRGVVMRALLLLPLALLAACNSTDDATGVTADEAAQLNAAADMLDINATDPGEPATR